jgi:hypothetical protein
MYIFIPQFNEHSQYLFLFSIFHHIIFIKIFYICIYYNIYHFNLNFIDSM